MFADHPSLFFALVNARYVAGVPSSSLTQAAEFGTRATVQNKSNDPLPLG